VKRALLVGHDDAVARFVAQFAPVERPLFVPPYFAFGVLKENGSLVAGVVFSDWKPDFRTLELSVAALSYASFSTQIVSALGDFAFGQLNAFRIFARTESRNRRAQNLLRHIGFTQEAVQGHYYGEGKHASCWRLIKPEWGKSKDRLAA
jgi:RimJ/RimL family protein N-acetyltransferase